MTGSQQNKIDTLPCPPGTSTLVGQRTGWIRTEAVEEKTGRRPGQGEPSERVSLWTQLGVWQRLCADGEGVTLG